VPEPRHRRAPRWEIGRRVSLRCHPPLAAASHMGNIGRGIGLRERTESVREGEQSACSFEGLISEGSTLERDRTREALTRAAVR